MTISKPAALEIRCREKRGRPQLKVDTVLVPTEMSRSDPPSPPPNPPPSPSRTLELESSHWDV